MNSELILQADGRIYHLGLRSEDIADVIFTVGDPDRVATVSAHFDFIDFKAQHREFVTHTGTLRGKRVSVISTGIGPDNIDIVINELNALVSYDLAKGIWKKPEDRRKLKIIRLGTSGSLQPDFLPGDYMVSALAVGLDNLMHFYPETGEPDLSASFISKVPLPKSVIPYGVAASPKLAGVFAHWPMGITLTAPGFYGPQGRSVGASSNLQAPFWEAVEAFKYQGFQLTNFEMETSAIYGLCELFGHKALSISVLLANRPLKQFADNPGKLVSKFIQDVLDKWEDIVEA